jgi:hypothetical protein
MLKNAQIPIVAGWNKMCCLAHEEW